MAWLAQQGRWPAEVAVGPGGGQELRGMDAGRWEQWYLEMGGERGMKVSGRGVLEVNRRE